MPHHGVGEGADVLEAHVVAALGEGAGLAAEGQVLRGPDTGPVGDPLAELGGALPLQPARPGEAQRVAHDRLGHRHLPDQLLELDEVGAGDRVPVLGLGEPGGGADDLDLLVLGWVLDDDVEHEAVELGLGQGIGALELDGVLRGEDEEGLLQGVGPALHGDPVLLHRLEQGRLGLGRGPVDLVGEEHVGEHRAGGEHHLAPARLGVLLDDVGAGDVGRHQVGGELDAGELQVEDLRHGLDEQGLGEARHPDDEAVAADEQRQQGLLDDPLLADDLLADLGENLLASGLHAVGERDVVGIFEVGRLIGEFVHGGHSPRPRGPSQAFVPNSARRNPAALERRCVSPDCVAPDSTVRPVFSMAAPCRAGASAIPRRPPGAMRRRAPPRAARRRPCAAATAQPARTRGRPAVQWVNAYMM